MTPPADSDSAFERRCLLGALLLIVVTSWFSIGFHHYDEHFQLLEFANFKVGRTPASDLPWEYHTRIRSWFQPAIAFVTIKGLGLVGIESPFNVALVLRLLSGLLFWWGLVRLVRWSRLWFASPVVRRYAIATACFLWFMPFLGVRFSSEGWAGSLFFLGFVSLVRLVHGESVSLRELGLAGFALGLAFSARYQAIILIGSALLWLIWIGRSTLKQLLTIGLGLGIAVGASLLLDRWGYGQWGLTPWRYVDFQVLKGVASGQFGSSPWWWYFPRFVTSAAPPIGLPLLAGVMVTWVKRPRSSLTWATLPFFACHCVLAHKELRFLFPLALVTPFAALYAFEALPAWRAPLLDSGPARIVWKGLVLLNAIGLVIRGLMPAYQTIGLQRAIYDAAPKRLLIAGGYDPYALGGLRVISHFYRPPDLTIANLTDAGGEAVPDELRSPALVVWSGSAPFDTTRIQCRVVYRSIPSWSGWISRRPMRALLAWARSDRWTLARCRQSGSAY